VATFKFNGKEYKYFVHTYNDSRHNERAVEVALALDLIKAAAPDARILEIGSVLPNYLNFKHDVVDKYDCSGDTSIIRQDIVDYKPAEKYDLILSISTFEHIGWDSGAEEAEKGTGKINVALEHTKTLLKDGGIMMITMPLGYNKELDQMLKEKKLHFDELRCIRRDDYNGWDEIDLDEALKADYRREPCFLGMYVGTQEQAAIIVAYTTYLVVGFVHGHKNYSLNFNAVMNTGATT
jgi:hypothetical protein